MLSVAAGSSSLTGVSSVVCSAFSLLLATVSSVGCSKDGFTDSSLFVSDVVFSWDVSTSVVLVSSICVFCSIDFEVGSSWGVAISLSASSDSFDALFEILNVVSRLFSLASTVFTPAYNVKPINTDPAPTENLRIEYRIFFLIS
ncbi:hypothetical protein NGB24_06170 [Mammaliicoccus vitulinus]|nr:hypothetical protein [Mammaliicoccus vitulinus]MEB7657434.1 hypothetical protein [Mammaliicoccus vitulinus]